MKPLVDDLYNSADTQPDSHAGRIVFAITVILVGYHSTFSRLLDPPWHAADARVAAVFALAAALAYAHRRAEVEVALHDRQVDWIVGVPLGLLAFGMNAASVGDSPETYWVHRVDLFSLPIFLAGIAALLFGSRALGRQRRALAFLFLAWPWPYDYASDHWPGTATGAGVVTSFIVVGIAVMATTTGRPRDMWWWLVTGTAVVWLTNVAVGRLGLVAEVAVFLATTGAMLAALPQFAVTYRFPNTREYVARVGHYRPPMRGAAFCAVIAAVVMAYVSRVGAP